MEQRLVFLANLDAERELADPQGYRRSQRMQAEIEVHMQKLQESFAAAWPKVKFLFLSGAETKLPGGWKGTQCTAWCPTTHAQRTLQALGLDLGAAPTLEVLQRVHHRAFAASLGQDLPGARFVTTMTELEETLRGEGAWLLKRPFGFSGRERKIVRMPLTTNQWTWAKASMEQYGKGLQVEPLVQVLAEFALHGWIHRDERTILGELTQQQIGPKGEWLGSESVGWEKLSSGEAERLQQRVREVAQALAVAGYFGPFNLDAYRWRNGSETGFQTMSEINARYSMGFAAGMCGVLGAPTPDRA